MELHLLGNTISGNSAHSTTSIAIGGGARLEAVGASYIMVDGNLFEDNEVRTDVTAQGTGAGILANFNQDSSGDILDNMIRLNRLEGQGNGVGSGGAILIDDTGGTAAQTLNARRNIWVDNINNKTPGDTHAQLRITCRGSATLNISDSVFAGGGSSGLIGSVYDTGETYLTNLTIADNGGYGVYLINNGTHASSFYNSISFRNGVDTYFDGLVATGGNHIGTDPIFADPASRNYNLTKGSPAIDTGLPSPPGGLSSLDAAGKPRVINGTVDKGAYEYN
jgi:hypothetical protein